jgi:hypothetical protein
MVITPKTEFKPAPVGDHRGVVVDVTPLKTVQGDWGPREVFQIVFELETEMDDGKRYMIRSRNFTASTHEKSNFRPFAEKLLGRKFTKDELSAGFETEELMGVSVKMEVEHDENDRGVFARICYVKRIEDEILPSGDYVRVKDRDEEEPHERQSEFRRTSGGSKGDRPKPTQSPDGVTHPGKIKVHVGKYKGQELADLSREDIEKLIGGWLERDFEKLEKPSADDRRLSSALRQYKKKFAKEDEAGAGEDEEDDVPY